MYTDLGLRLATAEAPLAEMGSTTDALGSDSVTLALEPGGVTEVLRNYASIGNGETVCLNINVDTAFNSGTFGSTFEISLVSLPIAASLLDTPVGPGTGRVFSKASVVLNSTTDEATFTGHGLPLGAPIFLTALATTTGVSNNTIYYAVPTGANTFKLATNLNNARAGTTIDLLTGNGSATINVIPTIHASTGNLPLYNAAANQGPLRVAQRLIVPVRPLVGPTPEQRLPTGQTISQPLGAGPVSGLLAANAQRYYYIRYKGSVAITGGAVTIDLVHVTDSSQIYMASGFQVI